MVYPTLLCHGCDQVGSILNFSLMYLLAPTAGAAAGGGGLLQRIFSEQTLLGWGAPGAVPRAAGSDEICFHQTTSWFSRW